jgi:hypothetical protein
MNRRALILLPILLVPIVAVCVAQESDRPTPSLRESKSNPPSKKPGQNTQAPKTNTAPSKEPLTIPQAPKSEAVPADTPDKTEKKTSPDWWIVYLTGALVFVGVCQIIAMLVQARWMRKTVAVAKESADAATATVKTMQETAERQLRAYVLPMEGRRFQDKTYPGQFSVQVIIENTGQTPAFDCTSCLGVGVFDFPKPDNLPEVTAEMGKSRFFLAPGGKTELGGLLRHLAPEEILAIQDQTRGIYATGAITYTDAFKIRRFAKFRMVCTGEHFLKGRFILCEEGNEAT